MLTPTTRLAERGHMGWRDADRIDFSSVTIASLGQAKARPEPRDRASRHSSIMSPPMPTARRSRSSGLARTEITQTAAADQSERHDMSILPMTVTNIVGMLHAADVPTSIAQFGQPHGIGVGKVPGVVKLSHVRLRTFRRLRVRFEHRVDIHEVPSSWLAASFASAPIAWGDFILK